jgi:hypothetical protein
MNFRYLIFYQLEEIGDETPRHQGVYIPPSIPMPEIPPPPTRPPPPIPHTAFLEKEKNELPQTPQDYENSQPAFQYSESATSASYSPMNGSAGETHLEMATSPIYQPPHSPPTGTNSPHPEMQEHPGIVSTLDIYQPPPAAPLRAPPPPPVPIETAAAESHSQIPPPPPSRPPYSPDMAEMPSTPPVPHQSWFQVPVGPPMPSHPPPVPPVLSPVHATRSPYPYEQQHVSGSAPRGFDMDDEQDLYGRQPGEEVYSGRKRGECIVQ